ncbi:MAG: hypothetical protein ACM3SQ_10720, partial [Betaproteobacteria bacterium]
GAAGVAAGGASALAAGQAGGRAGTRTAPFRATRHAQDNWLDAIPGGHRVVIDAVSPDGAGAAILFAANLYTANEAGYHLGDRDLAIVICMRHFATPFAYSDAFWQKYGTPLGQTLGKMVKLSDPKTSQAPVRNIYQAADIDPMSMPSLGNTLDSVLKRGTHLAVCDMATHFMAQQLAKATSANEDAVYKELVASAVSNSHFVTAGVVGINRAQERGYTLIYAG